MANDYPFAEVVRKARELTDRGFDVHQKFSCANCNSRLTIGTPNVFHETGDCDQCGHVTDIKRKGCNYLVMASTNRAQHEGTG